MNRLLLTSALALTLGCGLAAQAQISPPVGGPEAKGNAPLKHPHTINDGSAKPGANSFTQGQARQHMLNSGYSDLTGLAKGKDGVWRGMAMHNGASVSVAMDFKGNVTEATPAGGSGSMSSSTSRTAAGSTTEATSGAMTAAPGEGDASMSSGKPSGSPGHAMHRHHRRLRHHRHHGRCAHPAPNGAACSGVSTLENGVSDKEVHAMQSGAHP